MTTSQNKLNAGAEYLLYRIWATLQTHSSIHPESLVTCVGGLAGYACRLYARQTRTEIRSALLDSPASTWALVSRAVLKLGEPVPDLQEIVRKASSEQETQLPDWHRPDHPAIVYLKQLWPQTLPIAQRFCSRPIHLPVLYGIALQRAIEHTQDLLSPTLAASISMECAVAMSRVELPEPAPAPAPAPPATPARKNGITHHRERSAEPWLTIPKRVPPSARVAAIACLAFVTTAGAMYLSDHDELSGDELESPATLALAALATEPVDAADASQASAEEDFQTAAEEPLQQAPTALTTAPAAATSAVAVVEAPADDDTPRAQPVNYGSDEGLMRDDTGQTIRMAAETEY